MNLATLHFPLYITNGIEPSSSSKLRNLLQYLKFLKKNDKTI